MNRGFTSTFNKGVFGGGIFGSSGAAGVEVAGTVDLFSTLPAAGSENGKVWLVRFDEAGQLAGLYYSDGIVWDRLGLANATEVKILYESNLDTNAYTNQEKIDLASNSTHRLLTTGNPHAVQANEVPFNNAASGLTATDVQAAIDEVDSDLDTLIGIAVTHTSGAVVNNVIARYDGTTGLLIKSGHAVAISDTNNITGVNLIDGRDLAVDGAKLDLIEDNAKDDQSAVDVPFNNAASGLTATDVQAAIDEVEGRVDTLESSSHAAVTLNASGATQDTLNLSGQEIEVNIVTTTTDGAMSGADKLKLNGVEALAEVNNISDANASVLIGASDATTLHHHDSIYYTKTLLNGGQLDDRYFTESEHVSTSAGGDDAAKPIALNGSGLISPTMLVYGTEYNSAASLAEDTHTGDTDFQQKVRLSVTVPAGNYLLSWSFIWGEDGNNSSLYRVQQDDTTDLMNLESRVNNSNERQAAAGQRELALAAGSYDFDIDYAYGNSGGTVIISDAQFTFWRVP